jgi:hypothetical protein
VKSLLPIHSPNSPVPPPLTTTLIPAFYAGLTSPFPLTSALVASKPSPPSPPNSSYRQPTCCRLPLNRRSASRLSSRWVVTRTRMPLDHQRAPLGSNPPTQKTANEATLDQLVMSPHQMRSSPRQSPGPSPIPHRWISTWRACSPHLRFSR